MPSVILFFVLSKRTRAETKKTWWQTVLKQTDYCDSTLIVTLSQPLSQLRAQLLKCSQWDQMSPWDRRQSYMQPDHRSSSPTGNRWELVETTGNQQLICSWQSKNIWVWFQCRLQFQTQIKVKLGSRNKEFSFLIRGKWKTWQIDTIPINN